MAKGENAKKFGKRRVFTNPSAFSRLSKCFHYNRWVKRKTHKIERMRAKQQLHKELAS